MKRLFTALGTTQYRKASYKFPNRLVETPFFSCAIAIEHSPDETVVFATTEAEASNRRNLEREFETNGLPVEKLKFKTIPIGSSREEAVKIFEAIYESIDAEDELIIDITTALRSIPVLMLSAVRFLQYAKNVKVSKIYYGAFDKGGHSKAQQTSGASTSLEENAPLPEVDPYGMELFVSLLDWATAVDEFGRTGSSRLLVELLREPSELINISDQHQLTQSLNKLSGALDLTLSQTIVVAAAELTSFLKPLTDSSQSNIVLIKPMLDLFKRILNEFEPFAVADPQKNVQDYIDATYRLIKWYRDRKRYSNALQLAQEWTITYFMHLDKKSAEEIFTFSRRKNKSLSTDRHTYSKDVLTTRDETRDFWENLKHLRNRIAHTESTVYDFQIDDPDQFDDTVKKVEQMINRVLALYSEKAQ